MQPVPPSAVRLAVPLDSLRGLPAGASFSTRSGRATATLHMRGDTVVVDAGCDSLRVWLEYYMRESARYEEAFNRAEARLDTKIKQRSNPLRTFLEGLLSGLAVGIVLAWMIIKKADK